MPEREMLEREVHQLHQIIRADAFALASQSTSIADRARLRHQMNLRSALQSGLLKRLSDAATPDTGEPVGSPVQAKASWPSGARPAHPAVNPFRPVRPDDPENQARAGNAGTEAPRSPTVSRTAASIWSLLIRNSSERVPLWTRSRPR
jgi:hypothetical protein